jgi:signal transduction histidine kinase
MAETEYDAFSVQPPDRQVWDQLLAARRRGAALYDLSTLINSAHEVGAIVALLITQVRQVFNADRAAVYLLSRAGRVHCPDAFGLSEAYLDAVNQLYAQGAGGRVLNSRRTLYIADAQTDPVMGPLRDLAAREGFRTLVIAPFLYQGTPLGALALYHDGRHEYGDDDLAALNTFANHVAVALTNVRLFEDAARQVRRLDFLAETSRLLNSSLDLGRVLHALTRSATDVLAEACAIYLLRKNDDALALTAFSAQGDDAPPARQAFLQNHTPRLGEPGIGGAVLRGELLLVDGDHPAAPGQSDPFITELGAHSYLVVPLLAQERLVGALVLWLFNPALQFAPEDITLARELADRAAVALENARLYERELRSQQAKDEFLSAVSHELRTPLTAILGYSQLIRKGLGGDVSRFAQQVDVIWSQAQRLHRLVETILDISNLETGDFVLNLERLDLYALVHTVLERVRPGARPDLAFAVAQDGTHCWMTGDRRRLEQVFSHLLSNAIKYSPARGSVRVAMGCATGRAEVRITDSGPGMTTAQLANIFQRYYQGDTPINRAGGLGLGLYIGRTIVEEHGGTLSAESTPGAGATFCVSLPAESDAGQGI